MIRGLQDGGVLCLAKHFPGHGDTSLDSHLTLPCVDKPRDELERMELAPFRAAIANGVPAIMTAHILFPRWMTAVCPPPCPAASSPACCAAK